MLSREKANTPAPMNTSSPSRTSGRRVNAKATSPLSTDRPRPDSDQRGRSFGPFACRVISLSKRALFRKAGSALGKPCFAPVHTLQEGQGAASRQRARACPPPFGSQGCHAHEPVLLHLAVRHRSDRRPSEARGAQV